MSTPPIEVQAGRHAPLGMPPKRFLADYWQKRPLLVRGAFPDWQSPLSPEDLAGLACEELALARIVRLDRQRMHWSLQQGPFEEAVFPALPQQDWTLLVQDVDKWDEDVRALLAHFEFLPRWRLDDVMVSFAAPGGSVGPHTDHYDVFLIQGQGHRRWQIDARPGAPQAMRTDSELKLLAEFEASHDWVLGPGDMLYLPPEVPHFGEGVDACMTFSVGMRAPSQAELLADFADHLERCGDGAARYADPELGARKDAYAIQDEDLQRARAALAAALQMDDQRFATWFGEMVTRYRNSGLHAAPPSRTSAARLLQRLQAGASLQAHPFTRMAWSGRGKLAQLHALGDSFACSAALARTLCASAAAPLDLAAWSALDAPGQALCLELLNRGHLALRPPKGRRRT